MKSCSWYIAESKRQLGNASMSDRELGEHFNVSQPMIAKAKAGNLSSPLAMQIARLLRIDAGEVLLVAHAEREQRPDIKSAWLAYAKKVAGQVLAWFAGLAVAVSLSLPQPTLAHETGGDERF